MEQTDFKLEEYKMLREEVIQYQQDTFRILQFGLTASAALFALAYSDVLNGDLRWIVLFTPWLVTYPAVLMITQRIGATWRIGRYLEIIGQDIGILWETVNIKERSIRHERESKKSAQSRFGGIPTFAASSTSPLMLIQVLSIVLSGLDLLASDGASSLSYLLPRLGIWLVISSIIGWTLWGQNDNIKKTNNMDRARQMKVDMEGVLLTLKQDTK